MSNQFKVRAVRDVDYVSAGESYAVERQGKTYHFANVRTGGRTSVQAWQFKAAVADGSFVVEEA